MVRLPRTDSMFSSQLHYAHLVEALLTHAAQGLPSSREAGASRGGRVEPASIRAASATPSALRRRTARGGGTTKVPACGTPDDGCRSIIGAAPAASPTALLSQRVLVAPWGRQSPRRSGVALVDALMA